MLPCSFVSYGSDYVQNGGWTVWGNITNACGNVDSISINMTDNASGAPLSGFGLYNVYGQISVPLLIETSGYHSDGIRAFNVHTQSTATAGQLTISDGLRIVTHRVSADGINLSITNSSVMNVGNNVNIEVDDGIGVRANLSNVTNAVYNTVNIGYRYNF